MHTLKTVPKLLWWYGCAVLYVWLFAAIALHGIRRPVMNWDMVAYMGVVESFSTSDPQKIHDATMAEAKSVYDAALYDDLTQKDPLTKTADAFYQQLPLYSIKPLYTGGVWLLHALGLPMPEATWVLSIIGALGVGVVCYFFIPSGLDAGVWWLTIWLFCNYEPFPLGMMARFSTPDTLCIALSIAAYCLWVYRQSFIGFATCFLQAQLARPDALMQSALLTLYFTFVAAPPYRLKRSQGIGFIVTAIILYLAVNYVAGNYGWQTLFYYKFIKKLGHPATADISFGLEQYINITRHRAMRMLHEGWVQFLLAVSYLATFLSLSRLGERVGFPRQSGISPERRMMPGALGKPGAGRKSLPSPGAIAPPSPAIPATRGRRGEQFLFIGILWLTWLSLAARFAFFPSGEERYYYPYYLVILYALAETITPCAIKLLQYAKVGITTGGHHAEAS